MPPPNPNIQALLARAVAAHQSGNIAAAEQFYGLVLQADQRQFDALHMLGVIEAQRGHFAEGLRRLDEALRARPDSADALINRGRMLSELGRDDEAVASYRKALGFNPRSPLAHNNLSIVLRRRGETDEALKHCDAALAGARDYPDAWNNRGNTLYDLGRMAEALESYDRALALAPNLAEAHLGRGNVLHRLRRIDEALAAYDRAIVLQDGRAEFHLGRGNALQYLHRTDQALAAYDRAIAINPNLADAWYGRGLAAGNLGRFKEQYEAFDRACALNPGLPNAEGAKLYAKLQGCRWDGLVADCAHLEAALERGEAKAEPLVLFAASASPAVQRKGAELYVAARHLAAQPLWRGERYRHDRIRLAYMSADFRDHPVAHLTAGLFEVHDRSRFELIAISLGPDDNSSLRGRIRQAFDQFENVKDNDDQDIADLIRQREIDIVVDLNGFTADNRYGVLTRRPAPIHVSYLGFLGTMGSPYVDYVIADRIALPGDQQEHYAERIVHLPDCFVANDDRLVIAPHTPSRRDVGLPERGFVFCSFNSSYKLNKPMFDLWLRLLDAVPESVLWLYESNSEMAANLRREAQASGIDQDRVVFAPRIAPAEHLARQRLADLFLDTTPYNAGATAAFALWSGIPLLTVLGSTFVGRMAASMLHAVGLPELVVASLADYEALAVKIAGDPDYCMSLKHKLQNNRDSCPLFDTTRFARAIEAAYVTMWERAERGEPPASFAVED
jgi:protein O-GlcNAc transferase